MAYAIKFVNKHDGHTENWIIGGDGSQWPLFPTLLDRADLSTITITREPANRREELIAELQAFLAQVVQP